MFVRSDLVRRLTRLAARRKTMVLLCGLLGCALPAAYGWLRGLPEPRIHDEFSYLLAADTFARGRLANPPHPLWEHFDSPHILHHPTYMSKYPPGQGLVLAAGQVLLGHPAWGIWLGVGFAAAAFCWMLQAWTLPRWAAVGTLFMLLSIGITSDWAQRYWGGMVSAGGGALFLGGVRRVLRDARAGAAIAMAAGILILANTRPFEGAIVTLPFFLLFVGWLCFSRRHAMATRIVSVVAPALAVLLAGAGWMLYYNWRVTADPWTMPYQVHHARYFQTPLFIFQSDIPQGTTGHERLRRFYDSYPPKTMVHALDRFLGMLDEHPRFLLGTLLLAPFLLVLPWMLRDRWLALALGTWLLLVLLLSLATFSNQEHYAAPAAALLYFVAVDSVRHLRVLRGGSRLLRRLQARRFLFVFLILWALWEGRNAARGIYFERRERAATVLTRQSVIERLGGMPGRHLVLVQYTPDYSVHDEWVYNGADLERAKILWAHDLGPPRNGQLVRAFSERRIWQLRLSPEQRELVELPSERPQ